MNTRAETLAAIQRRVARHRPECALVDCPDCTIAWLLQDIEFLKTELKVRRDMDDAMRDFLKAMD